MKLTGRVTVDTEPRHKDEPDSPRMQGHRIHTGLCGLLLYVDIYRYGDGNVRAYARRRPGHPLPDGGDVTVVAFRETFEACVQRHLNNEIGTGRYTGDHALSPAPIA
jgi:hypothetical protein